MARDFEALYRAQAEARTASNTNLTVSLPPGYLVGYDVRLRPDYTVVITAGAANVGGRLVQITEDHQLAYADWIAPKINSTRHYYIYLSKAGQWFIDIVAPVWNNEFLYYEQPDTNWRAVGKIFLADGQIIFGIKEVEKNEQTVTVAPAGFTGKADYYCTGENDQILINAAIRYLHEAYDGGECHFLQGTFYIDDSIDVRYDNISITGSSLTSKLYCGKAIVMIEGTSTSGNVINNFSIANIFFDEPGTIKLQYYKNVKISNNIFWGPHRGYWSSVVYLTSIDGINITSNTFDGNEENSGPGISSIVQTSACTGTVISNNIFRKLRSSSASIFCVDVQGSSYIQILGNSATDISTSSGGAYVSFVEILSSLCLISNNRIENLKAPSGTVRAIWVYDSTRQNNSIIGNYCYNNGSDAGIANTNGNNFYDAGTDTQVIANSWQGTSSGGVPSGSILSYGGTSAPTGYLLCDGTSYLRADYTDLYTAIGTAYGTADGTHFNVPDLRGQFIRGKDGGAAIDPDRASRTALKTGGATGDNVGSKQTTATKLPGTAFTMTTGTQSANHNHAITYKYSSSGGSSVRALSPLGDSAASYASPTDTAWTGRYAMGNNSASHTHSASTWGGGDNESRPPNVNVTFIIKT